LCQLLLGGDLFVEAEVPFDGRDTVQRVIDLFAEACNVLEFPYQVVAWRQRS
jgi:hypothetical protein